MNWSAKVEERTKDKIELLFREFDKFVEDNHSTNNNQDAVVLREWTIFKQLIQQNPTDFQTLQQHISKMGAEEKTQMAVAKDNTNAVSSKPSGFAGGIEINKGKLKRIGSDLLGAIGKNNKELFRV